MPRHLGFAAGFVVTAAVVVPIAWHPSSASIERDGKHVRPLQQELEIGDAHVTVDVDHNLIHGGDSVIAKLRARADKPQRVAVDLEVYRSDDLWGGRTSGEPKRIDIEHLTLDATPDGGKPVTTQLVLAGNGPVNTFRIFVGPRGDHARASSYEGTDVAGIPVLSWAGNTLGMTIKTEGKVVAGEPFTVAVRLTNTTGAKLRHVPGVSLGTQLGLYGGFESGDDFQIEEAPEAAGTPPIYDRKLAVGASDVQRFIVTPKRADINEVTFVASAYVWDEEPGPVAGGAMDAKTIRFAPANAKQTASAKPAASASSAASAELAAK